MERWLDTLPQKFLRAGLSQTPGDNLIVSDTDVGEGKSRPRSSHAAEPMRVGTIFTTTQVELFMAWWRGPLGHGSHDFWFPNPATTGLVLASDDGDPLATDDGVVIRVEDWLLVRFQKGRRPTFEKRQDLRWNATLELDRLY